MGIIAALGNEVNTGLHVGVNEGCDPFERLGKLSSRVGGLWFVFADDFFHTSLGNECIHHSVLEIASIAFDVIGLE